MRWCRDGQTCGRQFSNSRGRQRIDPDRPCDVLDVLVAPVLKKIGELVADLVAHHPRDADSTGLGQRLQSRSDVDAITVDVVRLDNHVTEVDADTEGDPLVLGRFRIAVGHPALDLDSAAHRVDYARKLGQHSVARVLHGPAAMFLDLGVDQLTQMRPEAFVRVFLIHTHQP